MTIFPANIFTDAQVLADVLREPPDGSSAAWKSGRNVQANSDDSAGRCGFFLSRIGADNCESITSAINIAQRSSVDYGYIVFDDPLYSTCLGAMFAVEKPVIQKRGLYTE